MGLQPPQGEKTGKEFDCILDSFEKSLYDTKQISDNFYSKASLLKNFQLNCDSEVEKGSQPDGLASSLNCIIARINFLNRRNAEILEYLDKLI